MGFEPTSEVPLLQMPTTRPISLGNINKLRLIDDGLLLQQLISELRIEFSNSRIPSISDSHIVCLLMLCCNAYEFNEATVKCYSNSMVCALWRIVSRVVTKLTLVNRIRSRRLDDLVYNRSVSSFQNCHMTISSSSLIRTNLTSSKVSCTPVQYCAWGGGSIWPPLSKHIC